MNAKLQSRPDLLLLLSLLTAILLTPMLNQDNWRRLVLAAMTFLPIVLSIVRLLQIKRWVWPSVLLALGNVVFVVAGGGQYVPQPKTHPNSMAFLAVFFGLTSAGLCATLYLAIDASSPGSIQIGSHPADGRTDLLYFSLVTLSTIGYGDIVPLSGSPAYWQHSKGLPQFST